MHSIFSNCVVYNYQPEHALQALHANTCSSRGLFLQKLVINRRTCITSYSWTQRTAGQQSKTTKGSGAKVSKVLLPEQQMLSYCAVSHKNPFKPSLCTIHQRNSSASLSSGLFSQSLMWDFRSKLVKSKVYLSIS